MSQPGTHGQPRQRAMGGPRLERVSIDDIVQTDVVTASRDDTVEDVVARMAESDVGSVVVVEDGQPVGLVTDRKIALSLPGMTDPLGARIDDLATEGDLITGTTDMSVFDVLERLSDGTIRRLPIVDENDQLAGIVTLDDIVVLLASELDKAGEIIRAQSPEL